MASLCPGYVQVEEFGNDDEYEEEEVTYVTLDMGTIEPTLVSSSSHKMIVGGLLTVILNIFSFASQGLDSATPFLQLSGTIFKGKHDSLLGTELIFTEGPGKDCLTFCLY